MKLTTAELREYQALLDRGKKPLPPVKHNIKDTVRVQNQTDPITGVQKSADDTITGLKNFNDGFEEEVDRSIDISNAFGQAVAQSISDSMRVIFDALMSGEQIDTSSLVKALVTPFADMAVQIGEVMIATGVAALAANAIGTPGGALGAILAGGALVALGTAAQSAIGQIGSNFGKGSGGGNYNYQGGVAGMSVSGTNANINVVGILKGEDIYLSNQKVAARKQR